MINWPTKEWYLARGVNLPRALFAVGVKLKTPIGTALAEKINDFPLCQYDCRLLDGEHRGRRVAVDFERAELAA